MQWDPSPQGPGLIWEAVKEMTCDLRPDREGKRHLAKKKTKGIPRCRDLEKRRKV